MAAQRLATCREDPERHLRVDINGSLHLFEAVRNEAPPVVVSAVLSAEYGHVPASSIPVSEEHLCGLCIHMEISQVCLDLLARQYFLDYKIPNRQSETVNTTGPGKTNDAPQIRPPTDQNQEGLAAAGD